MVVFGAGDGALAAEDEGAERGDFDPPMDDALASLGGAAVAPGSSAEAGEPLPPDGTEDDPALAGAPPTFVRNGSSYPGAAVSGAQAVAMTLASNR